MKRYAIGVLPLLVAGLTQPTLAADWPQFGGPNRNGISSETGWKSQWGVGGPKSLWKQNVGKGYSSLAVAGGRVYTLGNYQNQDFVTAFDAKTGKVLWQYKYPCGAGDYEGPRATPTISGNNVYTLSREGLALCLNAQTGKVVWQKNLTREVGASAPQWGFAGSPLVNDNLVIYTVGEAGTALNKANGAVVWKSGGGSPGYSSPIAFTNAGKPAVAIFGAKALMAIDPANGRQLWQFPWDTAYDVNAANPVFTPQGVFISSNYGKGGTLLNISGGRPTPVWQTRDMKNHFHTSIALNGALFGNDENTLKCIDLKTGQERWKMRGMGKGGLMAADNKLIVLTERGELVIVEATPTKFNEIARAKVADGECWTQPVLANGLLYCRTHEGELICLDLRG